MENKTGVCTTDGLAKTGKVGIIPTGSTEAIWLSLGSKVKQEYIKKGACEYNVDGETLTFFKSTGKREDKEFWKSKCFSCPNLEPLEVADAYNAFAESKFVVASNIIPKGDNYDLFIFYKEK